MRALSTYIAFVLAALLICPQSHADEPTTPTEPRLRRVAVLPALNFAVSTDTIWNVPAESSQTTEASLLRYLLRRLAVEPHLDVIGPEAIVNRLRNHRTFREGADLGLERMRIGQLLYRELRVVEAIPHLEQAQTALINAFHDVVDPQVMSDLSLTLALCYQEQGSMKTHLSLKEMLLMDPSRRFERGFYSEAFERAVLSALTDLLATTPKENPLRTQTRLDQFMDLIQADTLVFAYLEPGPESPQIRIVIHDRISQNVEFRGSFQSTDQPADLDRIDRFISRWTTCLPPRVGAPDAPPQSVSDFFIDTSFTYSAFGSLLSDAPLTNSVFHNLGMGLSAEWQFLRGLGTFVQLNVLVTTQDSLRDLKDPPPILRTTAGLSYAFGNERWRGFARFGIDSQFLLGEFRVTTDPWCKWVDAHPKCNLTNQQEFQDEYLIGVHAGMGVQMFVQASLYLTLRTGVSVYVAPAEAVGLNFPISADLGLGYKF
jgi:hypothetical protein